MQKEIPHLRNVMAIYREKKRATGSLTYYLFNPPKSDGKQALRQVVSTRTTPLFPEEELHSLPPILCIVASQQTPSRGIRTLPLHGIKLPQAELRAISAECCGTPWNDCVQVYKCYRYGVKMLAVFSGLESPPFKPHK